MIAIKSTVAKSQQRKSQQGIGTVLRIIVASGCILVLSSPLICRGQESETGDLKVAAQTEVQFQAETTVGMAAKLEALVLPGSELVTKEIEDRHQPFVLRIVDTYKHGTDHRYDMEFYALEPGSYNISDYLVRADESEVADLPAVWVSVISTLPSGQITPNEPQSARLPQLGGYWLLWIFGGVAWLAGLFALVMIGRKKPQQQAIKSESKVSMAEHLRPLIEAAIRGQLDASGRAELERSLIAYWCKRLELQGLEPGEVIGRLRQDPQAGPLISSLEDWLHRPRSSEQSESPQQADIEALLAPYKDVTDSAVANIETQHDAAASQEKTSKLATTGAGGSS